MTLSTFIALLPALLGMAAGGSAPVEQVSTLVAQDETIMRIPVRPRLAPVIDWVERRGPRCIPADAIRGATLAGPDHVDFLMPGRQRIRAELAQDCPALDFYNGFYLSPEDDRLCAGRDSVRSRVGGSCRIERFRHLVPKPRQ